MENLTAAPVKNRNKSWSTVLRMAACLVFAMLTGFQHAQAHAADNAAVERTVKAAYLYKFGNFIDWPEHAFAAPDSAFAIGVIGADGFADDLEHIVAGRT